MTITSGFLKTQITNRRNHNPAFTICYEAVFLAFDQSERRNRLLDLVKLVDLHEWHFPRDSEDISQFHANSPEPFMQLF